MLKKSDPARGRDSWCWPEVSWPLVTRMVLVRKSHYICAVLLCMCANVISSFVRGWKGSNCSRPRKSKSEFKFAAYFQLGIGRRFWSELVDNFNPTGKYAVILVGK